MLFGARDLILYRTGWFGWYFPFQRVNRYRITSKMYHSKYRLILDCIGLTGGYHHHHRKHSRCQRPVTLLFLLLFLSSQSVHHTVVQEPKWPTFSHFSPSHFLFLFFFFFCALIQSPTKPTWTIKSSLYFKFLLFWLFYKSLFFFICLCYLPTSLSQFHLFSF